MAGRFPGAADVATFWKNLRGGVESITFFSDEALLAAGEAPARLRDPAYVKASGLLADIDKFDAPFFGMSPRDAAVFDPQHRFFLECAWSAFEDAGYVGEAFQGRVAVFASCGAAEYMMYHLTRNRRIMETVGAWLVRHNGNDPNFLATRVSYELNLDGPSMNVQTACSSALVAVHVACQSLLSGECDMALAGGTTIYPGQDRGYLYKQGEILSPDGHCRTFDAKSAGTVMASATGCVLLRRLEDALRDGDRVLAIVRGSAINNDGAHKVGYLAPSVRGQANVISDALAVSGVEAEQVSYVEAHGTATLIGDPIEVTGLTEAFRAHTDKKQFCAIGSLKSNIGHAGEAAGVCGLIKTVLSLQHRELPPSLHYETPNPQIDFADSPFFVNARLREWNVAPGAVRIAGVTALGAGGTNVHLLVQEAPESPPPEPARAQQLVVLSAKTPTALEAATRNLAAHLRAHPELPLADVAYTLLAGRKGFSHRRALVARSASDAAAALEGADPARLATFQQSGDAPSVVFMFPGGGAQYARMGLELYESERTYREAFDACLSHVDPALAAEIRALCLAPAPSGKAEGDPDAGARLESPTLGLPALFACEYATAKLLAEWGVAPSALIGHSAGEYAAACISGVLEVRDAVALVALRGRLFDTLPEGAMLSVALSEQDARPFVGSELSFAAVNAPSLCVLSGPVAAIRRAEAELIARDVDCTRVHINVAAHSAMLEPILDEFGRFCRSIRFGAPKVPFVSNVTGTWITEAEARDPAYWVRHLRQTVRFGDGVETVLSGARRALVEVGPGRTLSSLARQQKSKPATVTQTLRHPREEASDVAFALGALGKLWGAGVAIDVGALSGTGRRRVSLPTYPFEGQRYWIDPDPITEGRDASGPLAKRPDVADWFSVPAWTPAPRVQEASIAEQGHTWLVLTDESPLAERVAAGLRDRGDRVVLVAASDRAARRSESSYSVDPGKGSDFDFLAAGLRESGIVPDRVLHLWACTPRSRARGVLQRLWPDEALASYDEHLARHHFSLLFLAQTFAADAEAMRVFVVSSRMHGFPGDAQVDPEKAVLLGACKVIPREYPEVSCSSIDVEYPESAADEGRVAARLVQEVTARTVEGEVVLRGAARWRRELVPLRLERDVVKHSPLREGAVVLVTGGLGGIGLTVAEHLARTVRARLVLVSRKPLPAPDAEDEWLSSRGPDDETSQRILRVRAIRERAEVMTLAADVSDLEAMRTVVERVRARFGAIDAVFHTAGILKDELIALRASVARSEVIDAKVKGALVLDALLRRENVGLFVLFSSVSSVLGLPGQSDYTAANAFLDALASARAISHPERTTLSIDWNAWQDVGMLANLVRAAHREDGGEARASKGHPSGGHPLLQEVVSDSDGATVFRTRCRPRDLWTLSEHVVRGGGAVMPGTGLLEIARAALAHRPERRAVELRAVVFQAPLAVGAEEPRTMHVRIERSGGGAFAIYGDSEEETFVTGTAGYVDAAPAERVDLAALRARCPTPGRLRAAFLEQSFMDFGPRWGNIDRLDLGAGEALVALRLPAQFAADLEAYALHPALLDMATGGAQAIIPAFDPESTFYVPFSYGRVLLRRPLIPVLFSHVRLREPASTNGQQAAARESAVFDVTLYDEHGDEIGRIEEYVMRRVGTDFTSASRASVAHRHAPEGASSALDDALREGMTPSEGIDALERVLAALPCPRVVASTLDVHSWLAHLAARAHAATGEEEGAGPVFARPELGAAFVAPRDDLERELASMWRQLLGSAEVGIHDDFFELGGQSLIAVRLFHRMSKTYGVELPMATLFQAPTIALCADLLRQRLGLPPPGESPAAPAAQAQADSARTNGGAAPASGPTSLVLLQRGGDRLPFYCVHGAGGNVLNFRDISRAMEDEQPFYGLQARGIDGVSAPHETIEEMAEAYLAEVRAVQPSGPYLLGGYSGGGLVAFEMARRLTEAGEKVDLLAFIDTFHPEMPLRQFTLRTRVARLRSEGVAYLAGALRRRREDAQGARDDRAIREALAAGKPIPFDLRDRHLTLNFERAGARYRPRPWTGRAILYRASEVAPVYADAGPSYGWDRHVLGGVEIVLVPGDHHTLLLGANAEPLVQSLRRALADVSRRTGPLPGAGSGPLATDQQVVAAAH